MRNLRYSINWIYQSDIRCAPRYVLPPYVRDRHDLAVKFFRKVANHEFRQPGVQFFDKTVQGGQ